RAYTCVFCSRSYYYPRAYYALFFFFNDTATTEISTLSLHDALPISFRMFPERQLLTRDGATVKLGGRAFELLHLLVERSNELVSDRKSTRLNSSHVKISYAVFCLKKKKKKQETQ